MFIKESFSCFLLIQLQPKRQHEIKISQSTLGLIHNLTLEFPKKANKQNFANLLHLLCTLRNCQPHSNLAQVCGSSVIPTVTFFCKLKFCPLFRIELLFI